MGYCQCYLFDIKKCCSKQIFANQTTIRLISQTFSPKYPKLAKICLKTYFSAFICIVWEILLPIKETGRLNLYFGDSHNPGGLESMHKSPTESFSQFYVATMKQLGVLILPPVWNVGPSQGTPTAQSLVTSSGAGMGTDISSCKFTMSTGVIKIFAQITWKREERFFFL